MSLSRDNSMVELLDELPRNLVKGDVCLSEICAKQVRCVFRMGCLRDCFLKNLFRAGKSHQKGLLNALETLTGAIGDRFTRVYFFPVLLCASQEDRGIFRSCLQRYNVQLVTDPVHSELEEMLAIASYRFGIVNETTNLKELIVKSLVEQNRPTLLQVLKEEIGLTYREVESVVEHYRLARGISPETLSYLQCHLLDAPEVEHREKRKRRQIVQEEQEIYNRLLVAFYQQGPPEKDGEPDPDQNPTCPVCQEPALIVNCLNHLLITHCGHLYHRECLKRWLKKQSVCPVDRRLIGDGQLYPISCDTNLAGLSRSIGSILAIKKKLLVCH
jgi:hypothetical protein